MIAERDPAAAGAWHTLFDQVTSTLRVPFEGEDRTIDEVLARVRGPVREQRLCGLRGALHGARAADADRSPTSTTRSSPTGSCSTACAATRTRASARDLDNEIPSAAVDVLLAAVERHHHLAHRWFRHKAKLLGLDKLALGDQYAPLGSTRAVAYDDATVARGGRARRLLAAHRRRRARPLPRQPHRRRAAPGQARRRVLRLDRAGRAAVHHAELHRPDGRRAHARARDRPRACSSSWPASARPRSRTTRRWRSPRCPRRSPR